MSAALLSLDELFPEGDYGFHLTLRRVEARAFFEPLETSGRMLAERARWLAEAPARYAAVLPEGEPLVAEFARQAASWGGALGAEVAAELECARGLDQVLALGRTFEPDILFLSADESGRFRLRGGALCFPTSWALEDKLGHTLEFIHGVVPGLNRALGSPIQHFLSKLKPGTAYLRHNWGLAATNELNLHPSRGVPAPEPPVRLDRLWLRVEHQALMALPETRGIVFGIRIVSHRLDDIAAGTASGGLRRALATMPSEMAAYKRLDAIREDVIRLL